MEGLLTSVKRRFYTAMDALGPGVYLLKEGKIICPNCGHDQMEEPQDSTRAFMVYGLCDKSGSLTACSRCGLLHWLPRK